jgi:hypothetical protein
MNGSANWAGIETDVPLLTTLFTTNYLLLFSQVTPNLSVSFAFYNTVKHKYDGRIIMKHKTSGIIVATFLLISMLFSGAAYAGDGDLTTPGITPDNPFYFLDKLGKNLGMTFTFGSEAKAKKALKYAEERLAEIRMMAAANKTKEMEQTAKDYDAFMTMLKEKMGRIDQKDQSDNISEKVAMATANHLDVLEKVKEQVPEKAQEAIEHAREASINGQVNALRVLAQNKPERAFDICANVTEKQLEKVRIRISDNVTADNVTRELDYAEKIADLEDEMADITEATGVNVTAMQERLAQSTSNRLEVLSGVYDKVPEKAQTAIANAIENSVNKYEKVVDKLTDKNVTSAISVNETITKIVPEKLREKVQISISNRAPTAIINSGNVTTNVKPQPIKPVPTKVEPTKPAPPATDILGNTVTPKLPVTVTANQTKEPIKTVKPGSNR